MYLIISGTNRAGSNTLKVAKEYQRLLKEKEVDSVLLSLEGLNLLKRDADFEKIENELIIPFQDYIFVSPEYNCGGIKRHCLRVLVLVEQVICGGWIIYLMY